MSLDVKDLKSKIEQGSTLHLSKAITLLESTRLDHRLYAEDLLSRLLSKSGRSIRIAISGSPGVGKSSFIEVYGLHLVRQGKKVAVLAIDPSSPLTGGSILGDKTRMEDLSKSENCFIRPSPSSGVLGGVARHTRETLLLCEAAGFDVIIIETVGIGQSEIMAASMTDIFVQLHQPYSGDELQGIKKGVMELADLVVVTKADNESITAAELAKSSLVRAISLARTNTDDIPNVLLCSSQNNIGIEIIADEIDNIFTSRKNSGRLAQKRTVQIREWLSQEITSELQNLLMSSPQYESVFNSTLQQVETGGEHCARAARHLVETILRSNS